MCITVIVNDRSKHVMNEHQPRRMSCCMDCTGFHYMPISGVLLYHPVTIAFYHDHSRDLTSIPKWKLGWAVTDETTTVLGTDPWAFSVRVPLNGEKLVVQLDERLSIVDIHQESSG